MTAAKDAGEQADSKHIKKHRNDVFRLVAAITSPSQSFSVPKSIFADIDAFCNHVKDNLPDANLIRDMGLRRITTQQIFDRLSTIFTPKQ